MGKVTATNMKTTTTENCPIISIPKIEAELNRGSLSVIEKGTIAFDIKRVYYLYDIPSTSVRGGHAHKILYQLLIPLSGSFDVVLDDGNKKITHSLNKPNKGLLIIPGIWRELENFSSGSVCLVLASEVYDEADYIRDYDSFIEVKS